jgi:hypothetical protein
MSAAGAGVAVAGEGANASKLAKLSLLDAAAG